MVSASSAARAAPELLFTENETNDQRLYGIDNHSPYVKDGINDYIVHGQQEAVNPQRIGTKAAAHYHLALGPGETVTVRLRFSERDTQRPRRNPFASDFDQIVAARLHEADEFYATVIPWNLSPDAQSVMRQAFAGLLWSKQFYHYVVEQWLRGDPAQPPPPPERRRGRNREWGHLYNDDVISMPDKWEYPWYAAWDLAFHCVPLALVDSDFAKEQLVLMLREWYMHPNGQLPAYEWSFSDVNPPVHAWAAWRVYKIEQKRRGKGDRTFLEQRLPQATAQLHLVGQPQGCRGQKRLSGGIPWARQHRRLRSQRPTPHGWPHRAVGRHGLDGHVTA